MKIFEFRGLSGNRQVVAVFGLGLVGSAIAASLRSRAPLSEAAMPIDWRAPDGGPTPFGDIESNLAARAAGSARVTVVWSAGRAGFSSPEAETNQELFQFRRVLALSERLAARIRVEPQFILISSAGGLFEGQRCVRPDSAPAPRRPYGMLKWEEERIVESASPALAKSIVRLSSVYGLIRPGQRSGLISSLIANGIRRRVSPIIGSMDTLRDFVWAADVGRFLAIKSLDRPLSSSLSREILASARPTSILEVRKIVEDLIGYPVFVSFDPRPENRENITFSASTHLPGWTPGDLKTNIAAIWRDAASRLN